MKEIAEIYKETKYIDTLFSKQYDIKSPDIIEKYYLELLVEFSELANETRCFKFWSKKESSKDKVLEEYIDCLFMILYFANITDVSLGEEFHHPKEKNLIECFLYLYELGIKLSHNLDKEIVKELMVEILYLAKLLGFTMDDLIKETLKKKKIIKERLNGDY